MNSDRVQVLTTALNDLLGFSQRNVQRAEMALKNTLTEKGEEAELRRAVMEARLHEAQRFFFVVRERVAEALR